MSHSRLLARIMGKFLKCSNDVKLHVDMIYPVGSIYMSVNDVSPATLFGGKWEQIKDKFLLASGDTYANGSTGGEASHNHEYKIGWYSYYGVITNDDKHEIGAYDYDNQTWDFGEYDSSMPASSGFNSSLGAGTTTATTIGKYSVIGKTESESNLPPYLTVNVWKRTK